MLGDLPYAPIPLYVPQSSRIGQTVFLQPILIKVLSPQMAHMVSIPCRHWALGHTIVSPGQSHAAPRSHARLLSTRGSKGVGESRSGAEIGCTAHTETREGFLQGPILLSLPGSEIPIRLCPPQRATSRKKDLESGAANRAAHSTFTIAANLTLPPSWPEAWALRTGGCFRGDRSPWGFPGLQECPDGLPSTSSDQGEDQQGSD